MSHFTDFTGYVVFIITSFLAGVESADQCLLNSKVLSCFSGVIMSMRSFFLLCYKSIMTIFPSGTGVSVTREVFQPTKETPINTILILKNAKDDKITDLMYDGASLIPCSFTHW